MKKITMLIENCINTPHKQRGRLCLVCLLVFIIGLFFTINNFIANPINTEIKLEKK
tara:strand:+ start:732 stop:899 length:168 start_codon:yes stop_codon:yes gene_type:complete